MPQTISAKRALRQDRKRELVNGLVVRRFKKAVKIAREKSVLKTLAEAASALDQAVKKGVIHKGKAARLKSRLSKLLSEKVPSESKVVAKKKKTKPRKKVNSSK